MKTKEAGELRMPRWEELPSVPQYLDQVLLLVNEWLGPFLSHDGRQVITRTMVNNYVKLRFLPSPVSRRYDRLAIASLFVIAILKPVYTIEEIAYLIRLSLVHSERREAYNLFCDYVEEAVFCAFNRTSMKKGQNAGDPRELLWNACNAFACQLYVRKIYLQEALSGSVEGEK